MGDSLGKHNLAKNSVNQGICGRIELQNFKFRMFLDSVLVENFVEKRVITLRWIAESYDDEGQLLGLRSTALCPVIHAQEKIQKCRIQVADKFRARSAHDFEAFWQSLYKCNLPPVLCVARVNTRLLTLRHLKVLGHR